jgi:hypothetical protein
VRIIYFDARVRISGSPPVSSSGLLNTFKLQVKVKVKVNFTLKQAMKAQRGSRGIALLFL